MKALKKVLITLTLGFTTSLAYAHDSIGLSISYGDPVYYTPAPVYYAPPPVVYYNPGTVYYSPAPVVYAPQPVYVQPYYGRGGYRTQFNFNNYRGFRQPHGYRGHRHRDWR